MRGARRLAATAALAFAAIFSASTAFAEPTASTASSLSRLKNVPVFFVADGNGLPVEEVAGQGPTFYLTRSQASLGLGMLRGERATSREPGALTEPEFHLGVTDLAAVHARPGAERYIKPVSTIDAAVSMEGVPLFVIRDKEGSPFTLRDSDGRRKVYFYLSESDARDFIDRVLSETKRSWDDIRLSVIPMDVILNSMATSKDPSVANWVIYPSAETRLDAAALKSQAALDVPKTP